jgi:anhydro-N-acetylmuramic acid kinase
MNTARLSTTRRVVGCMSGTSLDALDAALVEIQGQAREIRARFVRGRSVPLGTLAAPLRRLAEGQAMTAREIAELSREFALLHACLVRGLLDGETCDLVCAHGQTVYHAPPLSWQLLNAPVLAAELGVEVVSDLRALDLAHAGQGAPITPIADAVLYRHATPCTVVNLGGFCNITRLPESPPDFLSPAHRARITGFDVCACNQLLDAAARATLGRDYDDLGQEARRGSVRPAVHDALVGELSRQSLSARSLGTGDELAGVLRRWNDLSPQDLLRTLCAAIAETIGARAPGPLILAGGGARNATLVAEIRARRPATKLSAEVGLPGEQREPAAFAVLGALSTDGVAITLPQVTGARRDGFVSGSRVDGRNPRP